jgi:hypothetical protein
MSSVRYELGVYIPEDDILHSQRRENVKSYTPSLWSSLNVKGQLSYPHKGP